MVLKDNRNPVQILVSDLLYCLLFFSSVVSKYIYLYSYGLIACLPIKPEKFNKNVLVIAIF